MMKEPENRTVLAFMAHPDDAEFLCAGTLIRLAERGWKVHIATAAPGDCGTNVYNRWDISSIRTKEATRAVEMIGGTYHCLDEKDGFIVYDKVTLRKAYDLFRRVVPSLVFANAPKDYMLDHEQASLVARAATFVYGAPNVSDVPLKPGSDVPLPLLLRSRRRDRSVRDIPSSRPPTSTFPPRLEKKAEMLSCHASQREWLLAHHGMDEYVESMRRHSTARGSQIGTAAAEAFVQHRGHAYPREDLLAAMFGSGETLVV